MENGSCLGLLREQDLALATAAHPLGHPRRLVRELIDGSPSSVYSSSTVAEALLVADRDAFLVHSAGAPLVGMVTAHGLLRALAGCVDRSDPAEGWDHALTLFQLTSVLPRRATDGDQLAASSAQRQPAHNSSL